jgi:hypothetical protein
MNTFIFSFLLLLGICSGQFQAYSKTSFEKAVVNDVIYALRSCLKLKIVHKRSSCLNDELLHLKKQNDSNFSSRQFFSGRLNNEIDAILLMSKNSEWKKIDSLLIEHRKTILKFLPK